MNSTYFMFSFAFVTGTLCIIIVLFFRLKTRDNELLEIQSRLNNVQTRAELASQQNASFIASAAHDLRQPLQALLLFSDALRELTQDHKSRGVAEKINYSVTTLAQLFNTLFDISKLETGSRQINLLDFSLRPLIQQIHDEFEPQMKTKGLSWQCEIVDMYVRSDATLLETIIRNLVSNALRYTPQGGIRLTLKQKEGKILIAIHDTGIGIAKHLQEDIFDEYQQLNINATLTGIGLGLTIVDRLIQLLGHTIKIESELGKGSIFSLEITAGRNICELTQPLTPIITNDIAGLHILVVDDDPEIRESLKMLLTSWQCIVHTVGSVDELNRFLGQQPEKIDTIFTDYQIAKTTTGLAVIEQFKVKFKLNMPVLFITGDTAKTTLHKIRSKQYPVLYKPVQPAQLRSFLRSVVRQKQSHQPTRLIKKVKFSIDPIISALVKEYATLAIKKGIKIHKNCSSINIYSDPKMLETMLRYLLRDAFRRSKQCDIHIGGSQSAEQTRITINDLGERLSSDTLSILKNHSRSPQKVAHSNVFSSGISIAYELAHQLQHNIEVESDTNLGNRFSIVVSRQP